MTRTVRKRKVLIHPKDVRGLSEQFGVTKRCIYNAISYKTTSELSDRIREAAIKQYGGISTYYKVIV